MWPGERHFVLDIDPRHNGNHGLHLLLTQHSDLPPAPTVRTADGGAHFYFRYPAHTTVPYSVELWGQGVQALGLHHYAVGAGSTHPSQTASEHCLHQWGMKPTVLDQRNPSDLHILALLP